ncbi:MAG: hypothetical protein NC120_00280 [Ruminococcus sp.]|nr:hypothetical protein [Ruminococcus sp.]
MTDCDTLQTMAFSLTLTVIFELVFSFAYGIRGGRNIAVIILVNTLTNPAVNCIYIYTAYFAAVGKAALFLTAAALEISAVCAEWLIYKSCTDIKKPFRLSLYANCFSFSLGLAANIIK